MAEVLAKGTKARRGNERGNQYAAHLTQCDLCCRRRFGRSGLQEQSGQGPGVARVSLSNDTGLQLDTTHEVAFLQQSPQFGIPEFHIPPRERTALMRPAGDLGE
jgi:hypothetical protein